MLDITVVFLLPIHGDWDARSSEFIRKIPDFAVFFRTLSDLPNLRSFSEFF